MGLLTFNGENLSFSEIKKYTDYVKKHGIIQFINTFHRVKNRTYDTLKWGDEKTDESEEKKRLGSSINEEVPQKKTGESTAKESYGANMNEEVAQNVETEKSEAEE
eukprot:gene8107-14024_t